MTRALDTEPSAARPGTRPDAAVDVGQITASQAAPRERVSRQRLLGAFVIAALADGLSLLATFTPPVQWGLDLTTAVLLLLVLGWHWALLPAMVMEAIPGLYVFPFWVLVVASVGLWGTLGSGKRARS